VHLRTDHDADDVGRNPVKPGRPGTVEDSTAVALTAVVGDLLRAGKTDEAQRILAVLATLLGGNVGQHEPVALATVHPIIRKQSS
jgi:hypothetical protein